MAYSKEQKDKIFETVFNKVAGGMSVRKALKDSNVTSSVFFKWLEQDASKQEQYTRAREAMIEAKFESIEDDYSETPAYGPDGKIDSAWVALQRLKIDSKKWELSKLMPKKYGDRVDVTSGGEKLSFSSFLMKSNPVDGDSD